MSNAVEPEIRADLESERTELARRLEELTADGSTAPDFDENFADSAQVAALFAQTGFKSLPVVDDDGRLVGVVSRSDILRAMSVSNAALSEAVATAFTEAGLPGRGFTVQAGHVTVTPSDDGLDDAVASVVATVPGVRSVRLG